MRPSISNIGLSHKLSVAVFLLVATLGTVIGLALWQLGVENRRQDSQIRGPIANALLAQQVDVALTRLSRSANNLLVAITDDEKAAAVADVARQQAALTPLQEQLADRIARGEMVTDTSWTEFAQSVQRYLRVLDEAIELSRQNSKTRAALLSSDAGAEAFQRMISAITAIRDALQAGLGTDRPEGVAGLLERTLQVELLLTDLQRLQKEIVAELEPDVIDRLARTIEQRARMVHPLRDELRFLPVPAVERNMQEFESAFTDWVRINRQIHELAVANTNGRARRLLVERGRAHLVRAQDAVQRLVEAAQTELDASRQRGNEDFERARTRLVGVALGGVAMALTLFAAVVRTQILTPLARLRAAMTGLAHGDLATDVVGTERRDETGAMARAVLVFKETAMALADSEARYRDLLENLTEGVYQSEASGQILSVNIAFARMLGYASPEEAVAAIGDVATGLYGDRTARARLLAMLRNRDAVRDFETQFQRRDGSLMYVSLTARAVRRDGKLVRVEGTAADITARLEAEDALRTLNAELEGRVRARTAELEATLRNLQFAQDELVRTEKLAGLGALVAGIAHEINTPIGNCVTVVTALQTKITQFQALVERGELRRSAINGFLADLTEAGELLRYGLQTSAELIGNFKRVAVDQTSDHRRSFDCRQVTEEVLSTLRPMARHRTVRFELEMADGLVLDSFPGAYGQIITNLVANTMLHGFEQRDRGVLRLSAAPGEPQAGWITLSFEDDGVGMPPEIQAKIFDPFFTTKLGSGGSGLGLHIVYSLTTRVLGGRISVHSRIGEGTRFVLALPLVAPRHDASAA